MKTVLAIALFASAAFAQHRAPAASAAAHPRPVSTGPSRPPNPVARPAPPVAIRTTYPRSVYVPYPVYVGGFYTPAYVSDGSVVVNQNYQPETVNPQMIDYSYAELPEPAPVDDSGNALADDQPTVYLIALTDHTVLAAIAYWVEGDTLNWVSRDAKQNHTSLDLVDRAFSKKLNDERHVPFKLPQPEN